MGACEEKRSPSEAKAVEMSVTQLGLVERQKKHEKLERECSVSEQLIGPPNSPGPRVHMVVRITKECR